MPKHKIQAEAIYLTGNGNLIFSAIPDNSKYFQLEIQQSYRLLPAQTLAAYPGGHGR